MDLRQIRYFLAVQETKSIFAASRILNVSQPAVSKRMKDLEASVGQKLFIRHARGTTLTDAGRQFALHAHEIIEAVERASHAFEGRQQQINRVVIGASPTPSQLLLPDLLNRVRHGYPQLLISARLGSNRELFDMLGRREVDAIFCYEVPRSTELTVHPLYREELYLVGMPGMLAAFGDSVDFRTVAGLPLVLDPPSHIGRRQVDQVARRKKVHLNLAAEIEPWAAKKWVVREQSCFTILPFGSCVEEITEGSLAAIRITDPVLTLTLSLTIPLSAPSQVARALAQAAKSEVSDKIADQQLRWLKI